MKKIFIYSDIIPEKEYKKIRKKLEFAGFEIVEFFINDMEIEKRISSLLQCSYYYISSYHYYSDRTTPTDFFATDSAVIKENKIIMKIDDNILDEIIIKKIEEGDVIVV